MKKSNAISKLTSNGEDISLDSEWGTTTSNCNCSNSNWTVGTTSNALDWSSVSTSTTATNGLSILGQTTPATLSWGGVDYASGYINIQDYLGSLITYLKEPEVENLLDTLIERAVDDADTVKKIVSAVIRSRHFSEDFVLKYFEYVSLPDIRCHHASDINSHSYERLALLIISSHD